MNKIMSLTAMLLFAITGAFAQNHLVDLSKGTANGVTLNGNTISTTKGGRCFFPVQDYSSFKGIKFSLSNFKKLDESVSNALGSLVIFYTAENGEEIKASASFWVPGRKEIRFAAFKNGNAEITIDPSKIKKMAIEVGANKEVEVNGVELIPNS